MAFVRSDLDLIADTDRAICPFCEEPTLTVAKIDALQDQIAADAELVVLREKLQQTRKACLISAETLDSTARKLEVRRLVEGNVSQLYTIFDDRREQVDRFRAANLSLCDLIDQVRLTITGIKNALDENAQHPDDPHIATRVAQVSTAAIEDICGSLEGIPQRLVDYAIALSTFEPMLKQALSDETSVARFTAMLAILNGWPQIIIAAQAKQFENEILECQRETEEYVLERQKEALSMREREMVEWYQRLSPNPHVRFSGLTPGKSEFSLRGRCFWRKPKCERLVSVNRS